MRHTLTQKEFQIATAIRNFMLSFGSGSTKWYLGITNNIDRRLFDEHNVDEINGKYFIKDADSLESADKIERYLLHTYTNLEGQHGLGKDDSTMIYIYKTESSTKEKTNEGLFFSENGQKILFS
jgi:hypothetical protein